MDVDDLFAPPAGEPNAADAIVDEAADGAADGGGDDVADVDALCALFDAPGEPESVGDGEPQASVDDMLGCLAPTSPSDVQASSSKAAVPRAPSLGPEDDLPTTDLALPDGVEAVPFSMTASFELRCEVDMKKVAFSLRHAEYNPRKHGSITIRLFEPRATALLRPSGVVSITGNTDPNVLKSCAKKVARLVQRVGHPEAKFVGWKINGIMSKASLGFPVRLDELAARWRKNAVYEPELYCGCVFRTRSPRGTYLITSGGKVILSGFRRMEDIQEALRRLYPVLHEFQH